MEHADAVLVGDSPIASDAAMTPRLRVAVDDLMRIIEHRLAAGPLTNDQIGMIVAALASAATEVEQV